MKFVIFHGSFGSPEGNWFPELAEKLKALGQEVTVPKFPTDDWDDITKRGRKGSKKTNQNLKSWLKTFEKEVLSKIKKGEKLCFVGHSLGPVFILHIVDKYKIKLDSAIFVSPFMEDLGGKYWQFYAVNKTFYRKDFDFLKLKKFIPLSYVLYSDNDPYVDKRFPLDFAKKLGSSLILVKSAGHMNAEVNLNEFPLVLELCKSRLDLNLYQKYLAHRKELFGVDYIKPSEEVIYLKPEEIFDEGVFKFRNLKKEGFCTFYTGISSFWDTQSIYYQESRRAARRISSFTRVFVVDKLSDLNKKPLRDQIELDLNAGIRVYLIMWEDIKDKVEEADFGIWDNEYLCCVSKKEVRLSSRKSDLKRGNRWQGVILKKAYRIDNADKDIEKFIKMNKKN